MRGSKFVVTVRTVNAAFQDDDPGELVRILRAVASRVESGETIGVILDVNGNHVGSFGVRP